MERSKELSERELAALDAVQRAVADAGSNNLYINFVRKFRLTREVERNYLTTCRASFTFGFRRYLSDEGGVARADVTLQSVLASDYDRLAHHFMVWLPFAVTITIEQGHGHLACVFQQPSMRVGNTQHHWAVSVSRKPRSSRA